MTKSAGEITVTFKITSHFWYLMAVLAGLSFGSIPIFSALLRDSGVSAPEQVFLRSLFAGLSAVTIIGYFFLKDKANTVKVLLDWRLQQGFFVQGVLLTAMIYSYMAAISLGTPAGEAALLVQVQPLFTLVMGFLLFREPITKIKICSLLLALTGIIILIRPWDSVNFQVYLMGDVLAILNGFLYSVYLLVGRKEAELRSHLPSTFSIAQVLTWSFGTAILIVGGLIIVDVDNPLTSFSLFNVVRLKIIVLGIGLALLGSLMPYFLLMAVARHLESSTLGILVLGEPLGAIVLGFLVLNEPITVNYIIGGGLLSFAISLLATRQRDDHHEAQDISRKE